LALPGGDRVVAQVAAGNFKAHRRQCRANVGAYFVGQEAISNHFQLLYLVVFAPLQAPPWR
jgi:hypothetical protein